MWSLKEKRIGFVLLALSMLYCFIEARGEGDLYIYLCAAGLLNSGGDIYLTGFIDEQYHYYYSVLFAIFLKPFYGLPYYGVKAAWLLLNLGFYLHLIYLLAQAQFVKNLPEKKQKLFLLFSVLFSFRFFHENMHASQITILILWCTVYGLLLITREKDLKGAILLAVGINIKLLPILLVPYLIYRGYFKAVVYLFLFLAILFALPSLLIGHAYNVQLLESWYYMINPVNKQHVLDTDERSFHGLPTLIATLFVQNVPDPHAMLLRRNLFDVSYQTLATILFSVRLGLLAVSLFFIKAWPFRKAKTNWQQIIEVSYLLLLVPLLFPHQQHYAFLFMCPAFCACLFSLMNAWDEKTIAKRIFFAAALVLVFLLCSLKILVGEFNRYYEHYKILTYAALLLIPILLYARKLPILAQENQAVDL